ATTHSMNTNCRFIFAALLYGCITAIAGCGNGPGAPAGTGKAGTAKDPAAAAPRPDASTASLPPPKTRPAGLLPSFRMIGRESGLAFERNDDIRGLRRILEANGGGAALFDFDKDGWLDVFLTNGCRLPLKLDDRRTPSELFRNQGDMHFQVVTGLSLLAQFGFATGCAVGDFDADGFDDLYVAALGPDALWRNQGDGTFADVTAQAGTHAPQWGSSAAFADINGDGHLDLYVVNYLAESDESPKLCPNPASPDGYMQCPPAMFDGAEDVLFLSDGAGRFVNVTDAAGIGGRRGKGLGVVISDFDGDGHPEIFVANDGEANFLFVPISEEPVSEELKLKFREQALTSGIALNESGYAQANMGIAAGDYDANGTLDLFITTFFGDTNTLFANRGGLIFEDVTRTAKLAATTRNKLGFGTVFLDADNNGWLDLFVANGHVDDRTWMAHGEPYRMRPQIYRNAGDGSFDDVSEWSGEYFHKEWLGRGVALGDLDRDGKIDAVVSHQLAPSLGLRNETPGDDAALVLVLVGTASNRNGYGARVTVLDAQPNLVRELVSGGSFQSASAPEIHIGLGAKVPQAIQIRWPSGTVDTHRGLVAGVWTAIEGAGLYRNYTSSPIIRTQNSP
ncbi:MAG TPA: CRTAC1 family protein, partial [Planctomycetaceae bacterium]